MTFEERVQAVTGVAHGLTERQAGFLVTVMLHSGVCLGRHYGAFAGIPYGRKTHDFYDELLARGYATARPCRHNTAKLYHVHHKPLYTAIGEPDNRHRKVTSLPRAVERIMLLDAVLADRQRTWFATEQEKVVHFTLEHRIRRQDLPSLTFRGQDELTVRYFTDKLPIGIDIDGRRHIFLYLVTRSSPVNFREFLERHAELFRALPAWTVRLLVPRHLSGVVSTYYAAFREQLAVPLRPAVAEELRWYFAARRQPKSDVKERFDQAQRAFSAPRFGALFRAWLDRGDVVLDATVSPVLRDAIARRSGQCESHVLPHRYLDLARLVGTA